jgi:undecaprenyl phosphate-alpha-L-ara4N flippase subunit ArnE
MRVAIRHFPQALANSSRFVLKATPLQVAYPFGALAFFVVPILAHFLPGESINWNTFAGPSLIAIDVWVSV